MLRTGKSSYWSHSKVKLGNDVSKHPLQTFLFKLCRAAGVWLVTATPSDSSWQLHCFAQTEVTAVLLLHPTLLVCSQGFNGNLNRSFKVSFIAWCHRPKSDLKSANWMTGLNELTFESTLFNELYSTQWNWVTQVGNSPNHNPNIYLKRGINLKFTRP